MFMLMFMSMLVLRPLSVYFFRVVFEEEPPQALGSGAAWTRVAVGEPLGPLGLGWPSSWLSDAPRVVVTSSASFDITIPVRWWQCGVVGVVCVGRGVRARKGG